MAVEVFSPPDGPLTPRVIPQQDLDVIELQLDRFYRARDAMTAWAFLASECQDFLEGRQITEQERRQMIDEGRPPIVLNKIATLTRLVKGYFRQNRTQIKYKPGNDAIGTQDVADTLNMCSKQIDEANGSEFVSADVFSDGLASGRGYFDTRMSFEDNIFGNVVEHAQDPFSTYVDPEALGYDPKTWGWVQTGTWMSISDVANVYGQGAADLIDDGIGVYGNFPVRSEASLTGTEQDITPLRSFGLHEETTRSFDSQYFGGVQGYNLFDHINKERKLVRIIECQHRKWVRGPFLLDLSTGDKRAIPLNWTRQRIADLENYCRQHNMPLSMQEGTYKRIGWTVTCADKVIYDNWSIYRDFTITPYFPYFRRGVTRGMVEDLLDPQREINKRRSNMLHILTTMAHSGWMWEEGALGEEAEEMLESEGARPGINLKYRKGYKAPERIMPGIPSRGHELAGTHAEEDLKQIAGINDSALGQVDVVQSGVAVQARQRQAVVGLEDYFDNWDRTVQLKGTVRLNIIQDYYTEPRIIRTRGDDGKDQQTIVNGQNAAGEIINDVTLGSYVVSIDKQPLSATFKDAQFQEAMEMRQQGIPVPDDVIVDLSSMPAKETIKARLAQAMAAQGVPGPGGPGAPGGGPPSSATPQPSPSAQPSPSGPGAQALHKPPQAQPPVAPPAGQPAPAQLGGPR